jgi:hypothetical protein
MGRFYDGDIQGKFWFAVQDSNAADRFGVLGEEPNYLTYHFTEDNLKELQEELESIKENLGDYTPKIKEFFSLFEYYTIDELASHLNVDKEKAGYLLSEYADLELGEKIEMCILEKGDCFFDAEY